MLKQLYNNNYYFYLLSLSFVCVIMSTLDQSNNGLHVTDVSGKLHWGDSIIQRLIRLLGSAQFLWGFYA